MHVALYDIKHLTLNFHSQFNMIFNAEWVAEWQKLQIMRL